MILDNPPPHISNNYAPKICHANTGDSQRNSRPYFYSASGRFARITRISDSRRFRRKGGSFSRYKGPRHPRPPPPSFPPPHFSWGAVGGFTENSKRGGGLPGGGGGGPGVCTGNLGRGGGAPRPIYRENEPPFKAKSGNLSLFLRILPFKIFPRKIQGK